MCVFGWGLSIILFSQITAKQINNKIRDSGDYSMSVDDKVGYSLFSIAIAVTLPTKIAQKFILREILDVNTAKKFAINPRDKILGLIFLLMTAVFFITVLIDTVIK